MGHNDQGKNHENPQKVDFFSKHNLKVIDVAVGNNHTLALTGIRLEIRRFLMFKMMEMCLVGGMEERLEDFLQAS